MKLKLVGGVEERTFSCGDVFEDDGVLEMLVYPDKTTAVMVSLRSGVGRYKTIPITGWGDEITGKQLRLLGVSPSQYVGRLEFTK